MRPAAVRLALAAASALGACGPGELRVSLEPVPVVGGTCGRPAVARSMLVTALGDFAEDARTIDPSGPVDLTGFSPETRQLSLRVLGDNGVVAAVGMTAPLQLGQLSGGDAIPIFMAPPDGFCAVGPPAEARDRPIVVRAGAGALILGGQGPGGPSRTAEYYDPATGTFSAVAVPSAFATALGFTGAAATAMPDGKVVVSGGPSAAYAIFDPAASPAPGRFEPPGALLEVRAFHAAVAIDAGHLLVAGGCGFLGATGACQAGSERATTRVLALATGEIADGPALATPRLGGDARLEATGADLTGAQDVLVTGGTDVAGAPLTTIERLDPAAPGTPATSTPGASGLGAPLAAGGVLVALAAPGAPAAGGAAVVAPGAPPHVVGAAPARAGATLTPLADGSVAAIGGAAGSDVARYLPAQRAWRTFPAGDGSDAPAGVAGAGAVLLDDGTVLVVGGHDAGGAPQARAWIYRPASLAGPFEGTARATPSIDDPPPPLDPLDPARVDSSTGAWTLSAPAGGDALASWAVIAGPRVLGGTLTATLRPTGGAAVLLGFTAPSSFDALVVPAGAPARLDRHAAGAITNLCTGSMPPADWGSGASENLTLVRAGDRVTATITSPAGPSATVLDCAPGVGARGLVGIGPVGAAASLVVDTVAVSR